MFHGMFTFILKSAVIIQQTFMNCVLLYEAKSSVLMTYDGFCSSGTLFTGEDILVSTFKTISKFMGYF